MAVETHGVTHGDVLSKLSPNVIDASRIDANSDPSTGEIDDWVTEGAGPLNAILRARGITPDGVQDDERELIRKGVIAYAAAELLRALKSFELAETYDDRFESVKTTLQQDDRPLGDEIAKAAEVKAPNVDTSSDKSSPTWGTDYSP